MKQLILTTMFVTGCVGIISGYISCWVDVETQQRLMGTAFVSVVTTAILPMMFLPIMIKDE